MLRALDSLDLPMLMYQASVSGAVDGGAGELAGWLRSLVALTENLHLVPALKQWLTRIPNSSSRDRHTDRQTK